MDIRRLTADPTLARTLSAWHQAQWGHLSDRTTEDRIAEFAEHGSAIPQTQVAFREGRPVGNASLLVQDMDVHPELTPWLGSVYVLPELRRQGIGTALVQAAVAEAARLQVPTLYLFTEDRASFYATMGWRTREERPYHGEQVTVMQLPLG